MGDNGDGEEMIIDEGDTLLAINVADPEIQRKALDMAYKVKGLYAPEKREVFGKDGKPIEHRMTDFPKEPVDIVEWERMRNEAELKRISEKTE